MLLVRRCLVGLDTAEAAGAVETPPGRRIGPDAGEALPGGTTRCDAKHQEDTASGADRNPMFGYSEWGSRIIMRPRACPGKGNPSPSPYLLVGSSSIPGSVAVESTLNRTHMPERPCPGTPQKIRYAPVGAALKRMTSVAKYPSPSPALVV